MTRLENVKRAGYYPIPSQVTDEICAVINAPYGGRVLDPCAGTGVALATIGDQLELDMYGVEINEARGKEAEKTVATTADYHNLAWEFLTDDYRNLRASKAAFNLLFLNPPYLFVDDNVDSRAEFAWLKRTSHYLIAGGLLVWVIPFHILRRLKVVEYLDGHFDHIQVTRFPDGEYERFKQIVLFGTKRPLRQAPNPATCTSLVEIGTGEAKLSPISSGRLPDYLLPDVFQGKTKTISFGRSVTSKEIILDEAEKAGVKAQARFLAHYAPSQPKQILDPLVPLRVGHLNGVIAAGHLNNELLDDGKQKLVIKGQSYKDVVARTESMLLPENGGVKTIKTWTDQVITQITTMDEAGQIVTVEKEKLEAFFERWLPHLTGKVQQKFTPRYQFDLNGYERILGGLNQKRLIPLVGKPGLLPVQAHAAAALATQFETNREAFLVGEMGTGKTVMGIATAAAIQARRTLVLCPPHLVQKWIREIEITWDGAKAVHLKTLADVDGFFANPHPHLFGVMKETTARAGSGWHHSFWWGGAASMKPRTRQQEWAWVERDEPQDGNKWHIRPHMPKTRLDYDVMVAQNRALSKRLTRQGVCCPTCGKSIFDENGLPVTPSHFKKAKLRCQHCKEALWQEDASPNRPRNVLSWKQRRYPLATYIKRQYAGQVDLLMADECHQFKGAVSDRGYAYARLCHASRKILNLTGTVYGGKASTLFYLLYRCVPAMRHEFNYKGGVTKWVKQYGIMQEVEESTESNGVQSGNNKSRTVVKELPGGSPDMLSWLLDRSVFVDLSDMGFALPDYKEIPVGVPMATEQARLYKRFQRELKHILAEKLIRNDKSLLAGYLQALIGQPDSPWRKKGVENPKTGNVVAYCEAVEDMVAGEAPKERAILELIQEELAAGRRCLLLCQQTNTLDITPQWLGMLRDNHIKGAVLRAEPSKRESWVKKQVEAGTQVIITHPKRVETGLDLLDFPTIIWMGTEYSVYTVLQASRRSWRIGQTKPVKVYFFYYEDTLQEPALQLVAGKVAAAIRVNGQTLADDSLAELDGLGNTDIVTALAKIAAGQVTMGKGSLQEAFNKSNEQFKLEKQLIGGFDVNDDSMMVAPEPTDALRFKNLAHWLDEWLAKFHPYDKLVAGAMPYLYALHKAEHIELATNESNLKMLVTCLYKFQPQKSVHKGVVTALITVARERLSYLSQEAKKASVATPQVPAMAGMTPMGFKNPPAKLTEETIQLEDEIVGVLVEAKEGGGLPVEAIVEMPAFNLKNVCNKWLAYCDNNDKLGIEGFGMVKLFIAHADAIHQCDNVPMLDMLVRTLAKRRPPRGRRAGSNVVALLGMVKARLTVAKKKEAAKTAEIKCQTDALAERATARDTGEDVPLKTETLVVANDDKPKERVVFGVHRMSGRRGTGHLQRRNNVPAELLELTKGGKQLGLFG